MTILVTGAAGFIGYHLAHRLLAEGHRVYGIDNLNDYYDVRLKQARLGQLMAFEKFEFDQLDISDGPRLNTLFCQQPFEQVVHLAAQAGVRYSLRNPQAYVASNLVGFANVLEGCRDRVSHLIYASSSSVYGANKKVPFAVGDRVDYPISFYAATKKSNELMAYAYSHLYGLSVTGLRFFTVYGPWGRPDMAYFKFVQAIDQGQPIDIYNHGHMERDFTYIDDVVEGLVRLLDRPPQRQADQPPYRLYNLGNHRPMPLLKFIEIIEQEMGKIAQKNWLPMQPGDVPITYADIDDLAKAIDFRPTTTPEVGLRQFVQWYQDYYGKATAPAQQPAVAQSS
ncbi:NAD-dependent epimerase [Nodosilinea sp. PGN35]|uniref:NAD-dependent epimerase n=1 Tax=Nodosilinea sp. PGN35 TaxID=3020489 RepID=UPI0023B210C1|nr:NAD-dependent epimerase [Nodosilinea sp. TSF1-S3]MDF0367105.1 NAD-dependent epimerase [Nodosilinea sp. TSF1-S3]